MAWQEFLRKISGSPSFREEKATPTEEVSGLPPIILEPVEIILYPYGLVFLCLGNTPNVGNPEARRFNDKGLSLAKANKFVEAAVEFSAASAAEPRIPGYIVNTQMSLLGENQARILSVSSLKGHIRITKEKTGDPSLPIYGPHIEKDHYERISQFAKRFTKIPGVQEVIDNAMSRYWESRYGGAFQIKVAEALGLENIRAFEEEHKPKGFGVNRIDIATKDDIAIECKNFTWIAELDLMKKWLRQAERRFIPDEREHVYKAIVIVIPDDKNLEEVRLTIKTLTDLRSPGLSDRIRVCQLSEVKETLADLARK